MTQDMINVLNPDYFKSAFVFYNEHHLHRVTGGQQINGETNRTEISNSFSMFDLKWARPVNHPFLPLQEKK